MKKIITTFCVVAGMMTLSHAQTALDFDGGDDVVDIGTALSTELAGETNLTVEAWVNPSSTNGFAVVIGNYNNPTQTSEMQFLIRRDDDQFNFFISDGTSFHNVLSGAGTVTVGEWQHVAGTWDGSELKIYIDGTEMNANTNAPGPLQSTGNSVGIGNNGMNESFQGQIDNVRIWNTTRSATNISDFMDCEVDPNTAGLLALYHFNDGIDSGTNTSNTLLFDNSGNGYHGTLQNFTLTGAASNFVASDRTNYMSVQSSIGSAAMADRISPSQPADFNGDGFDDLLVSTEGGARDIYYNNGLGHFEVATAIPNPLGGRFAVGDIDNDGDIDLVNFSGTSFKVYVNDGAGNFTESPVMNLDGTGNISVARIEDINGDGLADIILGNSGTNGTDLNEIWLNDGSIGSPSFDFLTGLSSSFAQATTNSIAIGDIDNDGDIDIAFGGSSWAAVVYLNDNNTDFVLDQTISGYNGGVRFIDWNQNGHLDLVNNDSYNNWGVRVRYNDGTGTFDANTTSIVGGTTNLLAQVEYADMNGDGFLDVISRHWGGNGMIYLSNGCEVTQETSCEYKLGPADNAVVVGDFNADGVPDVFCGARDRKSTVSLNYLDSITTPALSNITSTIDAEVCDGNQASIEATASSAGDFTWYSDVNGNTQVGLGSPFLPTVTPGTYTFYVQSENPNGCTSLMDSAEVIVNENPEVELNSSSVTELDCFGDTDGELNVDVTLNGTATSSSYLWDDASSSTTQNLIGVGAGTYSITLTDNNGCTAITSGSITEPDEIDVTATTTDETSGSDGSIDLTVSGGTMPFSYDWTGPNGFVSTDQNLTGLEGGIYEVTITDDNGCEHTTEVVVNSVVGINENTMSVFNIYPNPSTGSFTISTSNMGNVDVIETSGKIVYSTNISKEETQVQLNNLARGVYTIILTTDQEVQTKKIVIK